MTHFFQALFLTHRFFYAFSGVVVLFLLSFAFEPLFLLALAALMLLIGLFLADIFALFQQGNRVSASRHLPRLLSLGDANTIKITLQSNSNLSLKIRLIDELPVQLQIRDFEQRFLLPTKTEKTIQYTIHPTQRGEYYFGALHLFLSARLAFVERRISLAAEQMVRVYPSIIQMKALEMKALNRNVSVAGMKKLRRIGHSYEFDHIKNYVRGDDYRSINWKASSRKGELMVNKYEDERAQMVYSLIDKSRNMYMPFQGLSLMDYAINATLAVSNIILKKYDRAGLITFSNKIGTTLKADNQAAQLHLLVEALYKEKEQEVESNYELLYLAIRRLIASRSVLLLYTNFESMYALHRVLPVLRKINASHLLVVVFFHNTEVANFARQIPETVEDIYYQAVAQQFVADKKAMIQKLRQFGIQAILTYPEELSLNVINKYMELKAKGLS
ncbi:MAG: DUF58 domain-containing protein [Saprospiraceae bacterium]|nr:DUF58 domain-containing protein [Saprospiraceae bacterium]